MTRFSALLLLVLLAGCVQAGAPVGPIPIGPDQPVDEVPPPPPDEIPPPPPDVEPVPDATFDQVKVGMTRAEVIALVGPPTEDPPEQPGRPDSAQWDTVIDGKEYGVFITFIDGRVAVVIQREAVDSP